MFQVMSVLTAMGMMAAYCLDLHGLLWPLQLALIGVSSIYNSVMYMYNTCMAILDLQVILVP